MWTARVSAICKVSESRWDNGTVLTVLLYPKAPTDYSFVGDIKASNRSAEFLNLSRGT